MSERAGMEKLIRPDLVTIDEVSLKQLAPAASIIARAEGLEAHARAVEKRLQGGF